MQKLTDIIIGNDQLAHRYAGFSRRFTSIKWNRICLNGRRKIYRRVDFVESVEIARDEIVGD